jgi:hypothetical protein
MFLLGLVVLVEQPQGMVAILGSTPLQMQPQHLLLKVL